MAKKNSGLKVITYKPTAEKMNSDRIEEEMRKNKKREEEERYAAAMAQQGITSQSSAAERTVVDRMLRQRAADEPALRQAEVIRTFQNAGQNASTVNKGTDFQRNALQDILDQVDQKISLQQAKINGQGRKKDDPAVLSAKEEYAKLLESRQNVQDKLYQVPKTPQIGMLPNDRITLDGGRAAYTEEEEKQIRKIQGRIESGMSKFSDIPYVYDPQVKQDIHNLNAMAVTDEDSYAKWLRQGANAGLYNDATSKMYKEYAFYKLMPSEYNTREYSAYIRGGIERGIFDGGTDISLMSTQKLLADIDALKNRRKEQEKTDANRKNLEAELYDIDQQQGVYDELGNKGLLDPLTQEWHKGKPADYEEWGTRGQGDDKELKYYYDSLLYDAVHGEGAYNQVYETGTDEDFDRMDEEIQEMWRRMEDGTIGEMKPKTLGEREAELKDITTSSTGDIDRQIALREEELRRRNEQKEYENSTAGAEFEIGEDDWYEKAISTIYNLPTGGPDMYEYNTSPEVLYILVNQAGLTEEDTPINGNVITQGANLYQAEKEYRKYAHMTPKMVETFNGLYLEDKEKAMAYLKTLEPYLNAMQSQYVQGFRERAAGGGLGALYGAETILKQPVAGVKGTVGTILALLGNKDARDKYSGFYKETIRNQQIRGARAGAWGDFFANTFGEEYRGAGEWLNGVTYSIADNLMAMATAKAGGAVFNYDMASDTATRVVQFVMSSEATASEMADALDKGMDPTEAAIRAIGQGLIEAVTEKYSIEALLKPDVKEMLGNFGAVMKFLGKNTIAEGMEEGASDILSTVWDEMLSSMYGHESELTAEYNQLVAQGMDPTEASRQVWNNWMAKMGSDIAAGALSGMIMSGGRVAMNTYNQIRAGQKVQNQNNTVGTKTGADQLIEAAMGMEEGSVSRKMAEDMYNAAKKGKKASTRQVGQLAQNMKVESSEKVGQIAEETVDMMVREDLKSRGVEAETVDQVAPIITKAVMTGNTQAIDESDRKKLAQDKRVVDAFKQAMSAKGQLTTGLVVGAVAAEPLSVRETVDSLLKNGSMEDTGKQVEHDAVESEARAAANVATEEEIREAIGRATKTGLDAIHDGKIVQVIGLKNGKLQLKTEDGTTEADIGEVTAAGVQLGTVLDFIKTSGVIDDEAASAIITGIMGNSKLSGAKYMAEAMNVYLAARTGGTYDTAALSEETVNAIRKAAEKWNGVEKENRLKKGKNQKKVTPGKGTTTFGGAKYGTEAWKGKIKDLSTVQREQANLLAEIFRITGNDLVLINDEKNDAVFGWEEDSGKITINLAAKDSSGASLNRNLLTIAGHELTHWLEQNSPEAYDQLRQYIFDRLRSGGADIGTLVMRKIDQYRSIKGQENISIEGAMAELVADGCDQVLLNKKLAQDLQAEYKGLAGKIRKYAQGFIDRWTKAAKVQSSSPTSRALMRQGEEVMDQIAQNWNIARKEAAGQRKTAAEAKTGTAAQMSVREDSEGRQLTQEQAEYFKDSKAVDDNGRLKVLYHGSPSAGFTVFSKSDDIGYFFTDSEDVARTYSDTYQQFAPNRDDDLMDLVDVTGDKRNYAAYLNLKNPMIIDGGGSMWNAVVDSNGRLNTWEELTDEEREELADATGYTLEELENLGHDPDYDGLELAIYDTENMEVADYQSTRDWVAQAVDNGYDGVIFKNIMDDGEYGNGLGESNVYVALNPNQIKSINNTAPTSDPDIRYSVAEAREGLKDIKDADGQQAFDITDGGVVTRYSYRSYVDDKGRDKLIKLLTKTGLYTEEQIQKWLKDLDEVAAIIEADRERLDYTPDRSTKYRKANGDVYKWTLDASSLCAKRLLYQGTFNEIQKLLPNTPLRPGDLIDLVNMMHDMGYQTPCGICYVESRRRHTGNAIEKFLSEYKGKYKPNYADLASTDGLAKLKEEHREAYDAFIKAMNKRGAGSIKLVQLRTDYRGDLQRLGRKSIDYLNSIGGIRIQSFSDFETPHMLDLMQAVMDMKAKGLKSQAYTKVPAFAWVFGDTGIKINLSLMGEGTGLDENGKLVFSNTEGMNYDTAMMLRNRYSYNVGTILVGMNMAHIKAAMADPRIDFIIPFHKSGWSKEEFDKMTTLKGYEDFEEWQNERTIVDHTADGRPVYKNVKDNIKPEEYWQDNRSGKENAQAYLDMCKERGIVPKFNNFLVDNGDGSWSMPADGSADGYWKTLIDYKMYDNDGNAAPQLTVEPNFNMEEARRIMKNYRGGADTLPVAEPVVEEYVKKYKEEHPLKKGQRYSVRDVSQEELKEDYESVGIMWDMTPEETYRLASKYSTGTANEDNFYKNSIGFWDLKNKAPNREPDHVSINHRTWKPSSKYWYTEEGVYRQSDHWGSNVASCSWYIKGRNYKNEGISNGKKETAFIKWDDLKAKGLISKNKRTGEYGLVGFDFRLDSERKTQYSVRELDDEYMAAAESGDIGTMEAMNKEAARRVGFDTDEIAYHGTNTFGFTEFNMDDMQGQIFVAYNPDMARTYTENSAVKSISEAPETLAADVSRMKPQELVNYAKKLVKKYDQRVYSYDVKDIRYLEERNTYAIDVGGYSFRVTKGELMREVNKALMDKGGLYQFYTRPGKQLVVDAEGNFWNEIPFDLYGTKIGGTIDEETFEETDTAWDENYDPDAPHGWIASTREIARWAEAHGYDSVRINNVADDGMQNADVKRPPMDFDENFAGFVKGDIGIFFNPNDVKSADPITYEDDGSIIPPSERYSSESNDLRYSIRDEGDMDVQNWMMTIKPEDLRTEQERNMLKQYQNTRVAAELARMSVSDKRNRIRALERKMREKGSNVADREALRKLNIQYDEAMKKLNREQERLVKITTDKGYAALMYREHEKMDRLVNGKTVKQVQQSVEALTAAVQRAQKGIEQREARIRAMASTEAVKQIQALLSGGQLDTMAAWLRKTYQSSMNKQELMAEMSAMRLKMAKGEDVTADAEALAWKLLYGIHYTQDDVLAAMRGMTLTLGPNQVKEIYGSGMTMKELRSRLAGTGIKVVQGEKSGLDRSWSDLRRDTNNALPENVNEGDQVKTILDLVESRREQAMRYGVNKYGGNIRDVTNDVLAATAAVNMAQPKDPQAMAVLRRMRTLITKMAGTMTESTEDLAEARAMLGEIVQHGKLASDMSKAMQQNVEDAIRYNNALVEQSEAVTWAGERLKLINQMRDKHTQEMLAEQEKWRSRIAKDKAARQKMADNMEIRKKINRNVTRVRAMLVNETDQKHVTEHMKGLAREMLGMIVKNDLTGRKITGISREDLNETARLLAAWEAQDGKFDISDLRMIEDEEAQAMVADALADIEDGIAEYNSVTSGKGVEENLATFGEALDKIAKAVAVIKGVIDAENSVAFLDRKIAVTDAAVDVMNGFPPKGGRGELKGRGAKAVNAVNRGVVYGNTTPVYFFKNLNNQGVTNLWNGMQQAENRNGLLMQGAAAWMDQLAKDTHYGDWDHEKKYDVTLNGATVQMNIEQIMAVLATWEREQRVGPEYSSHMERGGIYLQDDDGETGRLHREQKPQRAHRVKAADIAKMQALLTDEQKRYMNAVVEYLSSDMSRLGNEASMRMYGIRKYKEEYYFPMKIWDGVKSARSDKGISGTDDNRIAHQGWSKRRKINAQNALVIGNFTDVAVKHMTEMINYATFAPEIENMNKVLNWQYIEEEMEEGPEGRPEVFENRRNIRVMFQENYGKEALRYLEEFMKDLQGGAVQDQRKTLRDRALSIFKKNAVAGSLSVAAQQPLSYIRAAMLINPKYLTAALIPGSGKDSFIERMKYSGVSVIKQMGRFDMNFGRSAAEFIAPEVNKKGVRGVLSKAAEATTAAPEKMDAWTWNRMWTAVKLEQQALNPDMDHKSDEFMQKVAERFNEVMRKTQVYDSILTKSSNMRSQNLSMKILTSFMAEPTLSLNVLADAVQNVKQKGGKVYLARAGATFLLSAVLQAFVKGLMGSGRTPDEKKTWAENFLYKWQQNLMSEANPFSLIPGYGDLIELLKNGELKDDAMGALGKIKSIITTAQNMFNPEKSKGPWRDIEDSAGQLVQLFTNVPAKNLMRDLRAMYNWVSGAKYADRETSTAVLKQQAAAAFHNGDNLLGVLNEYLGESGYSTTNKGYFKRLYNAKQAGNTAKEDEIREYMTLAKGTKKTTIDSGLRSVAQERMAPAEATGWMIDNGLLSSTGTITDQYKKGDITRDEAKSLYKAADSKLTDNDIWWKLDRIDWYRETGENESGYYYRLEAAVNANKAADIQKAVDELLKHGITKEKIKSKMSDWKAAYLAADSAGRIKIRDAIQKAYKAAGYTAADADKTIKNWTKK